MPKYLVQLTPEGGLDGTRVVDAAYASIPDAGGVAFYNETNGLICAFSYIEVVVDLNQFATIEADTAAFFEESTD
jgi:hypothetical protein